MSGRILPLAFLMLLALHGALLLSVEVYPLIDLPYHLSGATIARFLDDPSAPFGDFYGLQIWPHPNVAHLLFCSRSIFPSVETAGRIFLLLCLVLLPVMLWRLIRLLGGDPWMALLGFLLVYHYSFSWGFVGFVLGVPLVLLGLELLIRHDRHPRWGLRLALGALLLALFFVHLLTALFLAFTLLVMLLYRCRLRDALALLPLLGMIAYWQAGASGDSEGTLLGELGRYYLRDFLPTLHRRGAFLFWDHFALFRGARGYSIATLFSGAIAVFALMAAWRRRSEIIERLRARRMGPAGLFLIAALLVYLFLPQKIPGTAHLYERFSVLFLLALAIQASHWPPGGSRAAGRRRPRGAWRWRTLLLLLCLLHLVLWTDYYRGFAADSATFTRELLPPGGRSGRLAAFILDYDYRGRPVYNHFPDYYTVWKHGITVSKVGDYRFYPVRRRATEDALPVYNEWIGKWGRYDGRYTGLEYILVRGALPPELHGVLCGYDPLRESGAWRLYGRTVGIRPGAAEGARDGSETDEGRTPGTRDHLRGLGANPAD
ncbi:MAG: hypothetical protein GF330_14095 [Candidatus Eisenbacteria bacterium]|nr:hypothetical protein [Candidatus Eisenbacteria bacterium]